MTESLAEEEESLLCPACGYDLRGRIEERCSECGAAIDAESLKTSQIPWAQRRQIGRAWAYLKTLWMVTIDDRRLRYEASRPQVLADARKFGRLTGALLTIALVGLFSWVVVRNQGHDLLAVQQPAPFGPPVRVPPWVFDLAVPWSAATTIHGVMPVMLIALSFHLAGAQRRLFDLPGAPPRRRERLAAIGCYATAPLALVGLVVLAMIGVVKLIDANVLAGKSLRAWIGVMLTLLGIILALTMVRIVQWVVRVRHGGAETAFLHAPYVLGLWLLGAVVWLGTVPWCVGLVWIIIDSFL